MLGHVQYSKSDEEWFHYIHHWSIPIDTDQVPEYMVFLVIISYPCF